MSDERGDGVAGFTLGPWPLERTGDGKRYLVGKGLVEGPHGYEVAEVYSDDCDHAVALANARLIAAAPDLYEALNATHRLISEFAPSGFTDPDIGMRLFKNQGRIHAALRKADGGSL